MKVIDLTDQIFGRLTVLNREGSDEDGKARWRCLCECGIETIVIGKNLRNGATRSCGCLHRETVSSRFTKHGHTIGGISPTYTTWCNMLGRCTNANLPTTARYMGRGITLCDRWLEFANFLSDMGERPKGMSIGRKDNENGYCPENCRWETMVQQNRNKNNNRVLELNGERRTVAEWAELLGVPQGRLRARLQRGWTAERVLTTTRDYASVQKVAPKSSVIVSPAATVKVDP